MKTLRKLVKAIFFLLKAFSFLLFALFLTSFFMKYFGPSLNTPGWIGEVVSTVINPFTFSIYVGKPFRTIYSGTYELNLLFNALLFLGLFVFALFVEDRVLSSLPGVYYLEKPLQTKVEKEQPVTDEEKSNLNGSKFSTKEQKE